jgi:hypothetical protein
MRKFTKSLMTLAMLCIAGVASAGETTIYSLDYSTRADQAGTPFWGQVPDDATVSITGGELVINNPSDTGNNWDLQLHIGSGISLQSGYSYRVEVTYKTTTAGGVTVALGTWGTAPAAYGQPITVDNDWQVLSVPFNDYQFDVADAFVMWQCRSVVGIITISKVEVIEIAPDVPPTFTDIITNGGLEGDENVNFTVKEQGVGGPFMAKIEDGVGVGGSRGIKVQSSDDLADGAQDWDTQFFISVPKKLATGTKYKVSFDYKASQDANGGAQWHNEPGGYVHWNSIGNQSFTTAWQTYERTGTVGKGDGDADIAPYTVAFNLSITRTATTYYFDNIKFEILDDDLPNLEDAPALTNAPYPAPAFTIGQSGYATFSSTYPVVFDGTVEAYTAVLNDEGYLTLTQIEGVAANTGVILKGDPGNYIANVLVPAPDAPASNDLQVSDGTVQGNGVVYALANKDKGVGFYKVADGESIPWGKAYLDLFNVGQAPGFLGFDGGTTSISELNVKNNAEGEYFNLAGQRVAQPTKGLYIVNGNKVVIK